MKVSVITISLNDKVGLKKTIQSVLEQSYKNVEYILIDGGSNDGSIELIKEQESNIEYWISEKDKGIYDAMNKGIDRASGDYLFFLNSGDRLFDKHVIRDFVNSEPIEEMLYGDVFKELVDQPKVLKKMPKDLTLGVALSTSISHQSMFLKSSLFSDGKRYDEQYPIVADWVFYINEVVLKDKKTKYLNRVISICAAEGVSENRSINEMQREVYLDKEMGKQFKKLLSEYKMLHAENLYYKRSRLVQLALKVRHIYQKLVGAK